MGDIHSIATIVDDKKKEEIKEEEEDSDKNDKNYESIIVNEIKNEKGKTAYKTQPKKRDIVINNIFIKYNKNINLQNNIKILKANQNNQNDLDNNDVIVNNESVYSSIKEGTEINNKDKNTYNKKRVCFNDSLNNSSIRYNSNDNFVHHLIFSESSSSVSENNQQ